MRADPRRGEPARRGPAGPGACRWAGAHAPGVRGTAAAPARTDRRGAAHLATQRRLHEQQRSAALLRLAWAQLPGALLALWQRPATRAAWVAYVLASAQARMPRGPWRIVHAPDGPAAQQRALAQALVAASGAAPVFEADAAIAAGLKIVANGNTIDGTLGGLLADRPGIEARLLHQLESLQ